MASILAIICCSRANHDDIGISFPYPLLPVNARESPVKCQQLAGLRYLRTAGMLSPYMAMCQSVLLKCANAYQNLTKSFNLFWTCFSNNFIQIPFSNSMQHIPPHLILIHLWTQLVKGHPLCSRSSQDCRTKISTANFVRSIKSINYSLHAKNMKFRNNYIVNCIRLILPNTFKLNLIKSKLCREHLLYLFIFFIIQENFNDG